MRRITVEEVKAAYQATGLKPIRKLFIKGLNDKCGCALTACAIASGCTTYGDIFAQPIRSTHIFSSLGLNRSYADGFTEGFDGYSKPEGVSDENIIGYDDGRAAALAIFAEAT